MAAIISMHKKEDLESKRDLIKRTVCRGATDDELQLFIHVCKKTGLDPFMKQIHAVKRKSKNGEVMTIQTGIDGLRLTADRTGNYSPGREPAFQYDEQGRLKSATAYIKKRTPDGVWHEVSATAFYAEYKPAYTNDFWENKGHIMLSKCAEALALRKAFPAEMSGLYTQEEMEQANNEPASIQEAEVSEESSLQELTSKLISELGPLTDIPYANLHLQEYIEFVQTKLPKDRSLTKVVESWIENPTPFLNHYKNWIAKLNAEILSAQKCEDVVNL